jgi:hypothetical protein
VGLKLGEQEAQIKAVSLAIATVPSLPQMVLLKAVAPAILRYRVLRTASPQPGILETVVTAGLILRVLLIEA